jgi:hypothetical protein
MIWLHIIFSKQLSIALHHIHGLKPQSHLCSIAYNLQLHVQQGAKLQSLLPAVPLYVYVHLSTCQTPAVPTSTGNHNVPVCFSYTYVAGASPHPSKALVALHLRAAMYHSISGELFSITRRGVYDR